MPELHQLIEQGKRLIVEQKHSEAEGIARIIDHANWQRDMRLQYRNEDISGDSIFKNLSEQIDKKYSSILKTLAGLTNHLEDIKNGGSGAASPREFFWSIWQFWTEELFWFPGKNDTNGVWILTGQNMGVQIIRLPEGFETWTLDSLAYLEKEHRVPSEPDAYKRVEALDYTYYSATYGLIFWLQKRSYEEESIRAFQECFRAYFAGYKKIGMSEISLEGPDQEEARSQATVQTLIGKRLFEIKSKERSWHKALKMYAHVLSNYHALFIAEGNDTGIYGRWVTEDSWDSWPIHKEAQDAFGKIKEGSQGCISWADVAEWVRLIIASMQFGRFEEIPEFLPFWKEALGWVQGSKLEPGELRDELKKEEDEKAEQRLTRYFFSNDQWMGLSQRAKQALVDADRLWFSHRLGASDAPLIHLQMATEDLLRDLFGCKSLSEFKCKLLDTDPKTSLNVVDFSQTERAFIEKEMPPNLDLLREYRNDATHGAGWPVLEQEEELAYLFNTFMGIGCQGILPRLAKLRLKLFPSRSSAKH